MTRQRLGCELLLHGGGKVDEDENEPGHHHQLQQEGEDGEEDAAHDASDRLGSLRDEGDGNPEPLAEEDGDEEDDGAQAYTDDEHHQPCNSQPEVDIQALRKEKKMLIGERGGKTKQPE